MGRTCSQGRHDMTADNIRVDRAGVRRCRQCNRDRVKAWKLANRDRVRAQKKRRRERLRAVPHG